MFSIRGSVIATIAIVVAAHGVSLAAKVDDPTTFSQDAATMNEDAGLADQFFHVVWTAGAGRAGMSRITGYVYNDYGQAAQDVELRISGPEFRRSAGEDGVSAPQRYSAGSGPWVFRYPGSG